MKLTHFISSIWGSVFTWVNPLWKVRIEGRNKIKPDLAYVMICNHQSMLDILVLYRLFAHYKWVSKIELFRIPFVGWNMKLNRYISVNRGNKKSHMNLMKECEANLRQGNSIMIFPEGTRSEDGNIQAFKDGAFRMAQAAQVPVLPILLDGTADTLPKKGLILKKKQIIRIKILDPIPYESFAHSDSRELAGSVRNLMVEHFQAMRKQ